MMVADSWLTRRLGMDSDKPAVCMDEIGRRNTERVPCRHCAVPILPENLARHEALHEETES